MKKKNPTTKYHLQKKLDDYSAILENARTTKRRNNGNNIKSNVQRSANERIMNKLIAKSSAF
jgi:hypothetical protein